jgi:hypothetical protein
MQIGTREEGRLKIKEKWLTTSCVDISYDAIHEIFTDIFGDKYEI